MRAGAILVAAGMGTRLGGATPKAFVPLVGRPLLVYGAEILEAAEGLGGFVAVVPPGHESEAAGLLGAARGLLGIATGGRTRQESVRAGLAVLPEAFDVVVVHDVARPLVSADLFAAVLGALDESDGAVPVIEVADTMKRLDGEHAIIETLPREGLVMAQTPQAFWREALTKAHQRAGEIGTVGTDDAALLEQAGFRVAVVPGDIRNFKITTRGDLELAAALLPRLGRG
jgi:2-C-methyl-D-erythritol 4-phosphate cytidylyltransferase